MPTKLVDDVRATIRSRVEEVPLSHVERALLMVAVSTPGTHGLDAVDELEAAITNLRDTIDPETIPGPARAAVFRLLKAARGVLDYEPPEPKPVTLPPNDLRRRADVDG